MSALPLRPVCVGWGAKTALGPSARHTGFYLRAGRNNFNPSPFVDALGEAITLSSVTTLPADLVGASRLFALAAHAVEEAIEPVDLRDLKVRMCLALPERHARSRGRAGELEREGRQLCEMLSERSWRGQQLAGLHPFALGGGGGAQALQLAAQLLHAGEADVVLVCGVDSGYDHAVLDRLARQDRLMTADNLDALRPGEAGACLLLTSSRTRLAAQRGLFRVARAGQGQEPPPRDDDEPTMGMGLSAALRHALEPLREAKARCNALYCDVTHEAWSVRELQIAIARFGDALGTDFLLQTPARELGAVGAASLPLYAALAAEAWLRGYSEDPDALCYAGSDHGLRAALLLQRLETGRKA